MVALANRREPRDLVDPIFADTHILPFPALVWAVVEKNPGLLQDRRTGAFFAPQSDNDWAHAREHRGALGGVVAQPADMPFG